MRYTEARLAPVTGMLLQDIDKETVEWAPNFSDEKMEPDVAFGPDDDPAAPGIERRPDAIPAHDNAASGKIRSLLQDIDKETVEWAPNFSDEKMEPTVLPARYPNLLTMGISGIDHVVGKRNLQIGVFIQVVQDHPAAVGV